MANSSASPKVTIVIPNWNTQRWLDGCLNGLRCQSYQDFQVILVDNGSTDESVAYVRAHFPEARVVTLNKNRGFAAAVNAGIKETGSEYVILLNVDTVTQPDWLASLVETIEQSPPEVGCLAPVWNPYIRAKRQRNDYGCRYYQTYDLRNPVW